MQRFLLVTFLTWGLLTSLCTTLTKTRAQNRSDEAQIRELQQKLQEPMPPENQSGARDSLAKEQSEAAIALLKLGPDSQLWSLLRHSSDDSRPWSNGVPHGFARVRSGTDASIRLAQRSVASRAHI